MNVATSPSKQALVWSATRGWLTLYRQLFAWIVLFNLVAAVVAAAGAWDWASRHRVQFAVTNTLLTVLTRNEVSDSTLAWPVRCYIASTYQLFCIGMFADPVHCAGESRDSGHA